MSAAKDDFDATVEYVEWLKCDHCGLEVFGCEEALCNNVLLSRFQAGAPQSCYLNAAANIYNFYFISLSPRRAECVLFTLTDSQCYDFTSCVHFFGRIV